MLMNAEGSPQKDLWENTEKMLDNYRLDLLKQINEGVESAAHRLEVLDQLTGMS